MSIEHRIGRAEAEVDPGGRGGLPLTIQALHQLDADEISEADLSDEGRERLYELRRLATLTDSELDQARHEREDEAAWQRTTARVERREELGIEPRDCATDKHRYYGEPCLCLTRALDALPETANCEDVLAKAAELHVPDPKPQRKPQPKPQRPAETPAAAAESAPNATDGSTAAEEPREDASPPEPAPLPRIHGKRPPQPYRDREPAPAPPPSDLAWRPRNSDPAWFKAFGSQY